MLSGKSHNEKEAVEKALLLCGFLDNISTLVHENYAIQVYIPKAQTETFYLAINYMDYYAFNRIPTREERLIYYRTARRLEKYEKQWIKSLK